jgi:hypothetical protein
MRWLLRLYPRDWRRRYGPEMEALLSEMHPGPRAAVDLVRGAIDARLHPQLPRRRGSLVPWPLVALVVMLSPLASLAASSPLAGSAARPQLTVVGAEPIPIPGSGIPVGATLLLALIWTAAAGVALALRSGALTRFCGLVAFRFVADGLVLPIGFLLAAQLWIRLRPGASPAGFLLALDLVAIAFWAGFAVLVLRRTRLPWPAALAAGIALELAAGGTGLALPAALQHAVAPALLEPLRITVWAAALTALAALRRPRRGWDGGPPGDAGVPARPRPGAPPVLASGARLDDPPADRIASRG